MDESADKLLVRRPLQEQNPCASDYGRPLGQLSALVESSRHIRGVSCREPIGRDHRASITSTVLAVLAVFLSKLGSIENPVERIMADRIFLAAEAALYGFEFPSYRAFLPEEVEASLRRQGFAVADVRGIASLGRTPQPCHDPEEMTAFRYPDAHD